MIKKIIKIQNVGKFVNYSSRGDTTFQHLTLIHADNGQGKTTLSAILRSLCTGEGKYILERCTLGQNGKPSVELLLDDTNTKFIDPLWDHTFPDMEIFDPTFVDENVYTGSSLEHDHKRNLYQFAIGKEGVTFATRIEELDKDIRDLNPEINLKGKDIEKCIIGTMNLDTFLNLAPVDDIDQKITDTEKEIDNLKKAKEIVAKSLLSEIDLPILPFQDIGRMLYKQLEDISSEADAKVKQHISQFMDNKGEIWISQGMPYIKDEHCPFCGQDISKADLVAAYRSYFNQSYADFKGDIAGMSKILNETWTQDIILILQSNIESNKSLSEFWQEYIVPDFPIISFENTKTAWDEVCQLLVEHVERKAASPLERLTPNDKLNNAIKEYENVCKAIENYNKSVKDVNQKIGERKEEIGSADLSLAQDNLQKLQNTKKRFSESIASLCTEYSTQQDNKASLGKKKSKIRNKLQEYTKTLLPKYQIQINGYLENFAADFRIVNSTESFSGGKPSLNYQISINDVAFDLKAQDSSGPTACFKNTLSSGDKSTLAFAFFLARLDQDPNLKNKTIILDDPIASLDGHRRTSTRQQIIHKSGKAKQVVLLSHDLYFLRLVWNEADKSTLKPLCIRRKDQGSELVEWDIERETQGEYFEHYCALVEYLEHGPKGNLREVARCIRPLIETNLRLRFPCQFPQGEWLGSMIGRIRDSVENQPLSPLKPFLNELSEINQYSRQYHHGENPMADTHPIQDPELRTYVERTLKVLGGVLILET